VLDPVHDECGIAAVYLMRGGLPRRAVETEQLFPAGARGGTDGGDPGRGGAGPALAEIGVERINVAALIPRMLMDLQNRGQLAAGISSFDPDRDTILETFKGLGAVEGVFRMNHQGTYQALMSRYAGRAAIGHVRYATCGPDDATFAQPLERQHGRKWKWYSFCFNGNIANYAELRQKILERGDYVVRDNDTEIIMHHLSRELAGDQKPDFVEVFRRLHRDFDGAYCLAFLNADGDLIVARDPFGFRPLCYAVKDDLFAAASESLPLTNLDFEDIKTLEPGCLIHLSQGMKGPAIHRFAESKRRAHCYFEWVYFSNVASTINGKSVYLSRRRMGEELARTETVALGTDCVAVPVPDTAKAACDAMAAKLGIPSSEGLIRNRYIGRTFIEGKSRREKAMRKYTPLPEVLEGKRVFLVEDSIVRSTTLRVLIKMLFQKGLAKEVHVRVACPPVMAPCAYGIDMSTVRELFAPKHIERPIPGDLPPEVLARLAADLGATSLRYLSVEALPRCIDLPERDLCLACLTGQYPTPCGEKLYQVALREKGREDGVRTYERVIPEGQPALPAPKP
jgi:amidophosphoribosyltransferase